MKFVGDTISSVQVQDAVDFIDWNWDADGEYFPANSYNAFYSVMKGLRLLGIETITSINVSLRAAVEAEFEVRDVESLRDHYALTLPQWVRRLRK